MIKCHDLLFSVCADVMFAVSRGRFKPGKHLNMGLGIKSMTGSRKVLDVLNHMGHSISYHTAEYGWRLRVKYRLSFFLLRLLLSNFTFFSGSEWPYMPNSLYFFTNFYKSINQSIKVKVKQLSSIGSDECGRGISFEVKLGYG